MILKYQPCFGTMFHKESKTIVMKKSIRILSHSNSSAFEKNIDAVQYYIKNTFSETRKEISEGLNSFKEGLTDKLNKTGSYIKNDLVLPVNNFIKDIAQIEREFEAERKNNAEYCICIDGKMIPAEEVLKMPMEENY
jgi:hypothetical protein